MTQPTRLLDELVASDNAATSLGITVHQAEPGCVSVELVVTDSMLNFGGTCHGGVLFHLADTAMSYVSNQGQSPAVATGATIDYVSPAVTGDRLRAVVSTSVAGRNAIHDGTILVGERIVALFRGKTLTLKTGRAANEQEGTE